MADEISKSKREMADVTLKLNLAHKLQEACLLLCEAKGSHIGR